MKRIIKRDEMAMDAEVVVLMSEADKQERLTDRGSFNVDYWRQAFSTAKAVNVDGEVGYIYSYEKQRFE